MLTCVETTCPRHRLAPLPTPLILCICRCCWTSSLGCGSTCRPPRQISAVSDATLWHLTGTWYRNLTWPQPHMCWVAGTRTLRPSRSPQSGFGRVSGNEDWWLPARPAAFPLPSAFPSWLGQNPAGQGWTSFSKQRVFQTHQPHGLSNREPGAPGASRAGTLLLACSDLPDPGAGYCLLMFFKREPCFLFKIKYLAVISALPPPHPCKSPSG